MEFNIGDIVENTYPIRHRVISDQYMISTPSKTKSIPSATFEPEDWIQYENIIIPPGTLWRIINIRLMPRNTELAQQLSERFPHSNDRLVVEPLKSIDDLDRDRLEQPALLFRPTAAGSVLYGS